MAEQDPSVDPATPQDQLKPAEGHFGQDRPSKVTEINPGGEQSMSGQAAGGYGQTGFSGDLGASGQVAEPGQAALTGNDQAQPGGGGLGQTQTGYGQSPDMDPQAAGQADVTGHDAQQQGSQGIGARQGTQGPAPTGGGTGQPSSASSGGPDLSKGLADGNRNI